ncbi:MAG: hypothetical protein ABFR53_08620, partial [Actinomycetota bacterium]
MGERNTRVGIVAALLAVAVGLVAAGVLLARTSDTERSATGAGATGASLAVDIDAVYDPVAAGEPLPESFRQLLGRDQIEPIYDPQYTTRDQVDWPQDMLILGVEGTETAKAYPITHLN